MNKQEYWKFVIKNTRLLWPPTIVVKTSLPSQGGANNNYIELDADEIREKIKSSILAILKNNGRLN